jgi:hypothetical protein
MADTLNPRPTGRNMLVLLGVLLLGVVAAAWGFWSRIRERHGRDNGWQHLRPASRPAPAAIPASAAPDTVAASATAASPEPSTRPVPDNPPAPEAAAELTPTPRPGHAVEPAAGKPGPPGSTPAPPAAQRPAPDQPADARRSTRSRAVPAASARTSVASAGLPSDAPFGPGSVRARSDGSSPEPAHVVKGKIATKVFYTPAAAYYTRTRADVWFRTADDARAAGFTERTPHRHR